MTHFRWCLRASLLPLLALMPLFMPALAGCSASDSQRSVPAQPKAPADSKQATRKAPAFSADSAYLYIEQQLAFGPRVPGSQAQQECAQWLKGELERHGASVTEQRTTAIAYDGTRLPVINLVGSYRPDLSRRILILSHWDSRHVADADPDPAKRQLPVPAANDGASGVGVILELARLAQLQSPSWGIDFFLTDAEDYGAPDSWHGTHEEEHWALGTQLWCKEARNRGYRANFGILLDMVGAADATFFREYYSQRYAQEVVNQVWKSARKLGYSHYFINRDGGGITDDHTFVNRMLGIPTIDIIDTRDDGSGTFYPYWHTTDDTLDKISRQTLQAVGDVLVDILY